VLLYVLLSDRCCAPTHPPTHPPSTKQSQLTQLVGVTAYSLWFCGKLRGKPEQPWRGFQLWTAAKGWKEYLPYGLPAAIMICLEWW
jgi:hypothetical protein